MRAAPWKAELAASFTRVEDLLAYLDLPAIELGTARAAAVQFPFLVTRSYAGRMRKGDSADPLLRQVLPVADELAALPGFVADPVGDLQAMAAPGVLHKYNGRVLMIATGACAINCRYCFRRQFPYGESQLGRQRQAQALHYVAENPTVSEVILSGGDPLVLNDDRLGTLVRQISAIGHVKRLRLHTRLPVVLPSRVTASLLELLGGTRLKTVVVIHANHPNEFDGEVSRALAALRGAGIMLLNQTVLLKGVNDRVESLAELSETLFGNGVLPYYLHVLDKISGATHFDLPVSEALALHEALRRQLPGYLVPRLVREEAGRPYKTLL